MKNYSKASIIISACLMIAAGIVVLFNPRATLVSLSAIIGVVSRKGIIRTPILSRFWCGRCSKAGALQR